MRTKSYDVTMHWKDFFFVLNFGFRLSLQSNRFRATKTISCENNRRNEKWNWLQHRVYTINDTRFVSKLNYLRPRVSTNLGKMSFKFSAPKIWETVPFGLKCLPHHKFKKKLKSYLLINKIWSYPWLYVLSLILFEIFISSHAAAD